MAEVFADAGYWIALLNPNDELHAKARTISAQIRGRRIVTSEMVFAEFLNSVARSGEHMRSRAVDSLLRLYDNPNVDVIFQTSARLKAAFDRYASRPNQRWSLTDCASFLIMEERGITEALAYNRDFVQAGFRALLREN